MLHFKIREVRHENLVQVIGACIDDGNTFILMEYYNRGSLQDVLMNYDIKLEQIFISSLVADIVRVSKSLIMNVFLYQFL